MVVVVVVTAAAAAAAAAAVVVAAAAAAVVVVVRVHTPQLLKGEKSGREELEPKSVRLPTYQYR